MADGSKTEKATPKKRRDERKKGHTFLSQDAVSIATLLTSMSVLFIMSGVIVTQLGNFMMFCLSDSARVTAPSGISADIPKQAVLILSKTVLPIAVASGLAAIAATMFQTKFLVTAELLKPKFSRLSPIQGFKRLFSMKSVIDALKGILKITLLMIIIYLSLKSQIDISSKYLYAGVSAACASLFSAGKSMVFKIVLAFVVVAAVDVLYQWWDYERQMRMSKQEVKEEYKQTEGDPQIKGKIKDAQRKMAQRRMMQQVPDADVIIRNPTHFAVALRYKPEKDSAPVVVAKGQDELALRIVKVGEENNVTIIENVPLARALYAQADLDREIPPEFYSDVAEVLVYVFKLAGKTEIIAS